MFLIGIHLFVQLFLPTTTTTTLKPYVFLKISHFKYQGILITKFNVFSYIVNWHIIYQKNNDNQVKLAELLF